MGRNEQKALDVGNISMCSVAYLQDPLPLRGCRWLLCTKKCLISFEVPRKHLPQENLLPAAQPGTGNSTVLGKTDGSRLV